MIWRLKRPRTRASLKARGTRSWPDIGGETLGASLAPEEMSGGRRPKPRSRAFKARWAAIILISILSGCPASLGLARILFFVFVVHIFSLVASRVVLWRPRALFFFFLHVPVKKKTKNDNQREKNNKNRILASQGSRISVLVFYGLFFLFIIISFFSFYGKNEVNQKMRRKSIKRKRP